MVYNYYIYLYLYLYFFINIEHKFDNIKDEFQKQYYIINDKICEYEKLIEEKKKYEESLDAQDICKRIRLSNQMELLLDEIKSFISNLKKKYKKEDEKNKIDLLEKRYTFLKDDFQTIHIKKDMLDINSYLNQSKDPGSSDIIRSNHESDRPLSDVEKKIIDEFEIESIKIDTKIDELGHAISTLKIAAVEVGEAIKGTQITKIIPKAVLVTNEVKSKTEMVNDLIKEIRKPCNFFCDLILILILLGLICILISIIRHKYF